MELRQDRPFKMMMESCLDEVYRKDCRFTMAECNFVSKVSMNLMLGNSLKYDEVSQLSQLWNRIKDRV